MKIITWNILFSNKNIESAIDHVLQNNADVICFQELNQNALDYLKNLKRYNLTYSITAKGKDRTHNTYKAILSKYKIINSGKFDDLRGDPNTLWEKVIKIVSKINKFLYRGIFADVQMNSKEYRIINLHLDSFISPKLRIQEFIRAIKYKDHDKINLICGDFNSYCNWNVNWIFLFLTKLKLKNYFINERREFDKLFEKYQLKNIFKDISTYALPIKLQLDHILVDENIKVFSNQVLKNRYHSDHRILLAEIE